MEFHEAANIFPILTGKEYKDLKESIASGFDANFPIITFGNKILDGRNRYSACLDLGIEPIYKEFDGDNPVQFVIRANINRRHLTPGQLAFCALEVEKLLAEKAKEKENKRKQTTFQSFEKSTDPINSAKEAAEQVGSNVQYIVDAKALDKDAPDLAEKVKSGDMTMNRAKTEYKKRKKKDSVQQYTEQVKSNPPLLKQYHVIYADPPWQYSTSTNTLDAVTDHHYSTMRLDDIQTYLNDNNILSADNAVLFLWATNPFLKKALSVVDAWGFEYKTNIVWVKTELKKPGVGYYVRGRHELLFICAKGSFTPLDNVRPPIGSVLEAPINEHSQKPSEVYEIIERLYPGCTYLELFGRNKRDGWDVIGDEA